MPITFILINSEIGAEESVLNSLRDLEGVGEAYIVYGVYDIIAKIHEETMERLKELITWKIRRLDKVRSTLTMIIVEKAE